MSFNPLSLNSVITTTSNPGNIVFSPTNISITAMGPETVPHFDCDSEIEHDITNILIYHDIFIDVKKMKADTVSHVSLNEGTRWTFRIHNNLYKVKFSNGALHFYEFDGSRYIATHENIPKLLLTIIHNKMGSCDKCAIPTPEIIFFQKDRTQTDFYDWGDNDWVNANGFGTNLLVTTSTHIMGLKDKK